jgi:hypothetical protein
MTLSRQLASHCEETSNDDSCDFLKQKARCERLTGAELNRTTMTKWLL